MFFGLNEYLAFCDTCNRIRLTADGKINLSPRYEILANQVSAVFNLPLDRALIELESMVEMMDDRNATWQRIALALGWNTWDLDAELDPELDKLKEFLRKKRAMDKRLDPEYQQKRLKELLRQKRMRIKNREPAWGFTCYLIL